MKFFAQKACRKGWFGANCTQQCVGHCQYETICNHVTGHCDNGCKAGWTGNKCDKGDIHSVVRYLLFDLLFNIEKDLLRLCNEHFCNNVIFIF